MESCHTVQSQEIHEEVNPQKCLFHTSERFPSLGRPLLRRGYDPMDSFEHNAYITRIQVFVDAPDAFAETTHPDEPTGATDIEIRKPTGRTCIYSRNYNV